MWDGEVYPLLCEFFPFVLKRLIEYNIQVPFYTYFLKVNKKELL